MAGCWLPILLLGCRAAIGAPVATFSKYRHAEAALCKPALLTDREEFHHGHCEKIEGAAHFGMPDLYYMVHPASCVDDGHGEDSDHSSSPSDHSTSPGDHSTSLDNHTSSGGNSSTGDHYTSAGDNSTSSDDHSTSSSDHSTSLGNNSTASGDHSSSTEPNPNTSGAINHSSTPHETSNTSEANENTVSVPNTSEQESNSSNSSEPSSTISHSTGGTASTSPEHAPGHSRRLSSSSPSKSTEDKPVTTFFVQLQQFYDKNCTQPTGFVINATKCSPFLVVEKSTVWDYKFDCGESASSYARLRNHLSSRLFFAFAMCVNIIAFGG